MRATLLNKAVDSGRASYDEFVTTVATMAKISEGKARQQIEKNVPDEELFAYILELKERYKIGLLSNAGDNWLHDIFTAEQVGIFDAVALSYDIGVIKPDARAYEIIADKLHVIPEECVFVDDQLNYIEGAKQAGMRAVIFTNTEDLRNSLASLLADS